MYFVTASIPPQIVATSIVRIGSGGGGSVFPPSGLQEITGVVVDIGATTLVVRDNTNRRLSVNYEHALHFCVGQRVRIRFREMIQGNPVRINAQEVFPVC